MATRARSEEGFTVIELVAAISVISIALLALLASYDQAFFSLHTSAKASSAGLIADQQLELYAALPYASRGLDNSTLSSVKASDATYLSDENSLPGSGTEVRITNCGSSPQCSPVQTVTGSDGHSYKLETFVRTLVNPNTSSWTEKVVTVIVRDLSESGSPKVVTMQTAFDPGPP
ncbi:MAG TPA: prepilin-type N-terminal cleavage/methylation domain-containing protein [Gaiellaceae bacterium]|nr:prepilin-type N-terminal cleavage/methylation domain-containing protein [Gaiellaceae bacterium]